MARSSKLDLASGCLSRDLGVKIINCEQREKVSVNYKQQIDSIIRIFIVGFGKTPEIKVFLSLFTLICCHHITRNISIGKTKHFFNNQINKNLCAQPTKSKISDFFIDNKLYYPLLAPSLICSGSHFLMLHKALHLCATGDQLRHSLWLKTVRD